MMPRAKVFARSNLDGVTSAIVLLKAFEGKCDVEYSLCSPHTADNRITEALQEDCSIYIVDLPVSDIVAKLLNKRPGVELYMVNGNQKSLTRYPWVLS